MIPLPKGRLSIREGFEFYYLRKNYGLTNEQIGKKVGLSAVTVSTRLNGYCRKYRKLLPLPSFAEELGRPDAATLRQQKALRLRRAGKKFREIAEIFGVSTARAREIFFKAERREEFHSVRPTPYGEWIEDDSTGIGGCRDNTTVVSARRP